MQLELQYFTIILPILDFSGILCSFPPIVPFRNNYFMRKCDFFGGGPKVDDLLTHQN